MPLTLAEKVKAIVEATGLTQGELADALGVDHQRIRNLAAGRVQKLSEEEAHALVHKLHIRAHWIATGEGPVKQTPEETALERRLQLLQDTSVRAAALPLPKKRQEFVRDVLYGVAMNDVALLNATIDGFLAEQAQSQGAE